MIISLRKERIRRNPPETQQDCVAFTVRQYLAECGEMTGYWRIRGVCHGLAKGLFGEAWDTAPKAQKLEWYRMALEQYRHATQA
jgi:hypothetical protein